MTNETSSTRNASASSSLTTGNLNNTIDRIILVGLGGIGSWLAPAVVRVTNKPLLLVDGDNYASHNLQRQLFPMEFVGQNKADVCASRLLREYPFAVLELPPRSIFLTKDTVTLIRDRDLVLLAVDNHPTRLLISRHCQTLRDIALVSGGNEFSDGNVQVYVRVNNAAHMPPIEQFHPEIRNAGRRRNIARNPGELSCEERALLNREQESNTDQTLLANMFAALLMLQATQQLLAQKMAPVEIYFDCAIPALRIAQRLQQS